VSQNAEQDPGDTDATVRRRGRRKGGEDTRAALLSAARAVFAESGYDGATVRSIATRAGVDPAMVNHWFGSKEGLFGEAVLDLPVSPQEVFDRLITGDPDQLGERIVRTFLSVWDSSGGGMFTALVRSVTTHEQATHVLRDFFVKQLFMKLSAHVSADQQEMRANLVATQMIGMGMVRYVVRFEPFASADPETVVAAVAPNLQRYLSGDIG
jgi:AcrR family transcriptional regulator